MAPNLDIDPALLGEFIDESLQGLSEIGNLFLSLEQAPDNKELIQTIFRIIHSMKGNSAFFGFVRVKTLAHEMETILDLARNDALAIDQNVSTVLLNGCDALQVMLERAHNGESEITDEKAFDALVQEVMGLSESGDLNHNDIAERILKQLQALKESIPGNDSALTSKIDTLIADAEQLLPKDGAEDEDSSVLREPWPKVYRDLYVQLEKWDSEPNEDAKAINARDLATQLLDICREDDQQSLLSDALESYNMIFDSIGLDPLLKDTLKDVIDNIPIESLTPDTEPSEGAADQPAEAAATPPEKEAAAKGADVPLQHQKTMRIPEKQIDLFLSYVGELLVIGDMFDHLHRRLVLNSTDNDILSSFKIANSTFSTLSDELQNSIMAIRKVPMSALLNKAPRIIRDIATSKGKKIEISVQGENILLDKSLMDILDAPLTHMVRNAADHGIEMPDAREAVGKDPIGQVQLIAEEHPNTLVLVIKDDGGGLDLDAIQAKAADLGLIEKGATLTPKDLTNFIFRSGVSTAAEITDVSGRGVGMDAVKRSVEDAGGSIEVETTQGNGSTFKIALPKAVTTRIMEGFLIGCNNLKFIVPMNRVIETSLFGESLITSLPDGNRSLKRHDTLYPLVSLPAILGNYDATAKTDDTSVVVTITSGVATYALHVDEVLGVQKVVAREIKGIKDCEAITGGALMGDGTIAFILDMDEIFQLCPTQDEMLAVTSPA